MYRATEIGRPTGQAVICFTMSPIFLMVVAYVMNAYIFGDFVVKTPLDYATMTGSPNLSYVPFIPSNSIHITVFRKGNLRPVTGGPSIGRGAHRRQY